MRGFVGQQLLISGRFAASQPNVAATRERPRVDGGRGGFSGGSRVNPHAAQVRVQRRFKTSALPWIERRT
jgi:hypothetical protein